MPKRKTIAVEEIKRQVNEYVKSEGTSQDARKALCSLLSTILLDTGNYKGFGYLESPYVEGFTDESRRIYY